MPCICVFGNYDPNYPRNKSIFKSLQNLGFKLVHCQDGHGWLIRSLILLIKQLKNKYDYFYIPYAYLSIVNTFSVYILAKIRNKPLIIDMYISLYDTYVLDKKWISQHSIRAKLYWLLDWFSLKFADKVLVDTLDNGLFYEKTYQINKAKIYIVPVTCDANQFHPSKKQKNKKGEFSVGFWGHYIPLQGTMIIIQAIKLLQKHSSLTFTLLGQGQEYEAVAQFIKKNKLNNIVLKDEIEYCKLPKFIQNFDLVIGGPFGESDKADRVIPNKVVEALACAKPVIVGNTMAMRRIFKKGEVVFCPRMDPYTLAWEIYTYLKNNKYYEKIANNGYKWFCQNLNEGVLNNRVKSVFTKS